MKLIKKSIRKISIILPSLLIGLMFMFDSVDAMAGCHNGTCGCPIVPGVNYCMQTDKDPLFPNSDEDAHCWYSGDSFANAYKKRGYKGYGDQDYGKTLLYLTTDRNEAIRKPARTGSKVRIIASGSRATNDEVSFDITVFLGGTGFCTGHNYIVDLEKKDKDELGNEFDIMSLNDVTRYEKRKEENNEKNPTRRRIQQALHVSVMKKYAPIGDYTSKYETDQDVSEYSDTDIRNGNNQRFTTQSTYLKKESVAEDSIIPEADNVTACYKYIRLRKTFQYRFIQCSICRGIPPQQGSIVVDQKNMYSRNILEIYMQNEDGSWSTDCTKRISDDKHNIIYGKNTPSANNNAYKWTYIGAAIKTFTETERIDSDGKPTIVKHFFTGKNQFQDVLMSVPLFCDVKLDFKFNKEVVDKYIDVDWEKYDEPGTHTPDDFASYSSTGNDSKLESFYYGERKRQIKGFTGNTSAYVNERGNNEKNDNDKYKYKIDTVDYTTYSGYYGTIWKRYIHYKDAEEEEPDKPDIPSGPKQFIVHANPQTDASTKIEAKGSSPAGFNAYCVVTRGGYDLYNQSCGDCGSYYNYNDHGVSTQTIQLSWIKSGDDYILNTGPIPDATNTYSESTSNTTHWHSYVDSEGTTHSWTVSHYYHEEHETWMKVQVVITCSQGVSATYSMTGYTTDDKWYLNSHSGGVWNQSINVNIASVRKSNSTVPVQWSPNDVYAHWCSEPGRLWTMANSSSGALDSCYAAYYNGTKNAAVFKDLSTTTQNEYVSNKHKRAFDTKKVYLDDPEVQPVTVYYQDTYDSTIDYDSTSTILEFDKWVEASEDEQNYMGYYKDLVGRREATLNTILNCGRPGCTEFHGTLKGNAYTFNDGDWHNDSKGKSRETMVKATFTGSWKIKLPNAYRDGYLFRGWYAGNEYIGDAGEIIDISSWARSYNTDGSITKGGTNPAINNISNAYCVSNSHNQLMSVYLSPRWEPIQYKVLYVMNIPTDTDTATLYGNNIQSHSLVNPSEVYAIDGVYNHHSLKYDGSGARTRRGDYGSDSDRDWDYSYVGSKTFIYDGSDWALDKLQITVNDYMFTGWTYTDVLWNGWGGMTDNFAVEQGHANPNHDGTTIGGTRYGNSKEDCYDVNKDYVLKTLYMTPNIPINIYNNLPDTTGDSPYYDTYRVDLVDADKLGSVGQTLHAPQTDATNAYMGNQASGLNQRTSSKPYVYVVLTANWTNDIGPLKVRYDSNNNMNSTYEKDISRKLIDYESLLTIDDPNLTNFRNIDSITTAFSSINTATGDTRDDGSYNYNETSDTFIVDESSPRSYYSGISNGRKGFFSFQGWSTWKFATWRDAIDLNKKDSDTSELETNGVNGIGHDSNSIDAIFNANSFSPRKYNDVPRSKRIGDIFYRGAITYLTDKAYNGAYVDKTRGNMTQPDGNGQYQYNMSTSLWDAYRWRWTQGTSGHYQLPLEYMTKQNYTATLYAIWDSYPTSLITNVYCYKKDIESLTPAYLFSKVIAYDYEDFHNVVNNAIGGTNDGNVDWNKVASASAHMNEAKASMCPNGDYTYTYNLKSSTGYMGGKFTATLVGYNFDAFKNAAYMDDIASVSMTFKFTDSAGNITYKTAWIYIIDNDTTSEPTDDDDVGGQGNDASGYTDNTRYSVTRFISKENYDKAEFDENGNYIMNSADEASGALLKRSKWYINEGYRNELNAAFEQLNIIGGSKVSLNLVDLSSLPNIRFFTAKWTGYHPVYEPTESSYTIFNDKSTWQWGKIWDKLSEHTMGIYQLSYDDIIKTKEYVRNNGNTRGIGNYTETEDTLYDYIERILRHTWKHTDNYERNQLRK